MKCLRIALSNYRRTLQEANMYDLAVVYRITQLWFEHSHDPTVNGEVFLTFKDAPTAKFVPLTYQIASRISATPDAANFQKTLTAALFRLAVQHPFHSCYSLIALSNGHLGPNGRPQALQPSGGALIQQQVDLDKVEAARALLQLLRQDKKAGPILA
jgi:ataxia telangiectasia mutated family protein